MSPTRVNDVSQLTLKTRQIQLNAQGVELFFNFADVLRDKNNVYINATGLMKSVKGESRQIQDYFRNKQTKDFIGALEKFLINANMHCLEKGLYYKKAGRSISGYKDHLSGLLRSLYGQFLTA